MEEVGLYREQLEPAEDYDLWLRIAERFEMANIREALYKWRLHVDSVTFQQKWRHDQCVTLARELAEERKKHGKDNLDGLSGDMLQEKFDEICLGLQANKSVDIDVYYREGRLLFSKGRYKQAMSFIIPSILRNPLAIKILKLFIIDISFLLLKVFLRLPDSFLGRIRARLCRRGWV